MKPLLKLLLSLFLLYFTPSCSKTVFIIVHGTWATQAGWYMPGGDFFNAVKNNTEKEETSVIPYCWSGKNNYKVRIKAAEGLVQLIQSYSPETIIWLITHSHGGNVGIIASQLLTQIATTHKINIFYALGTPISTSAYQPNMDRIEYFYNLFSFEDYIQPVLGFFQREYPPHERIANIRVTINNKEPTHEELHSPLVGQWLPFLHEFLTTSTPSFDFTKPGIIHFADNTKPFYEIDKERKQLLEKDALLTKMIVTALFRNH